MGKTELVRRLVDRSGSARSLIPMKEVVISKLPPQASAKEIFGSILKAMGLSVRPNESTFPLRERVYKALREWSIRVVVLDEVNHLAERGSNLTPRVAADHLKALSDETGVSLILSGLPRFQAIIDQNEQLRDRACGSVLLKPYDWQIDDEREAFVGSVAVALKSLDQSGFPVALDFEDIVRRLYGASGGRIPVMLKLLMKCAQATKTQRSLRLADLAKAAQRRQQSGIPTSSFFMPDEPDEIDLLRSFASVMSEAGMNFTVMSIAGLGAAWEQRSTI